MTLRDLAVTMIEEIRALRRAMEEPAVAVPLEDACRRLGCSERTARGLLTQGKLRGEKIGKGWMVNVASIDGLLQGKPTGRAAKRSRGRAGARAVADGIGDIEV